MKRPYMAWASWSDWMAVFADLEPADARGLMSLRGVATHEALMEQVYQTHPTEVAASQVWLDEHDRPLAITGFSAFSGPPGTREAWSLATPRLRGEGRHALAYTRQCRRMCDSWIATGAARRLFAYSWTEHPTSARWLKALGFEREGVMRQFGTDGADFAIYGRT